MRTSCSSRTPLYAAVAADTSDYVYILGTTGTTVYKTDGVTIDYITYPAIVAGETTTIKTASTVGAPGQKGLYKVAYTDGKIAQNADLVLVNAVYTAAMGYRYAYVANLDQPAGGMINAGGVAYSYADDCVVYIINANGTVAETTDVDGYEAVAGGNVYLVNNNAAGSATATTNINTIKEIYIQK
jgi:hypothetical protein